jgi:thiol-disulfide isomerase/thioredoxin
MNLSDKRQQLAGKCGLISVVLCWAVTAGMCAAILFSAQPSLAQGPAQASPARQPSPPGNVNPLTPDSMRKPAPNFTLTDAKGETIELSAFKGKVVLLDFWATWCGGCKVEIPWYKAFDKKYEGQGLAVIGVAMDAGGWKSVRPFLALKRDPETGGNTAPQYPVVIGSNSLAKRFNLTSLPMTLLIDREGRIAVSHTGMVDEKAWERDIRSLLKQS